MLLCGSIAGCVVSPLSIPPIKQSGLDFASDYDSVYSILAGISYQGAGGGGISFIESSNAITNFFSSGSVAGLAAKAAPPASKADSSDYSSTNVQVEGIDEGDIVKTDGAYIYVLRNGSLLIYKADGANTRLVSKTMVIETASAIDISPYSRYEYKQNEHVIEMYLCGDLVVVTTQLSQYDYWSLDNQRCNVYIYDATDRVAPKLSYKLGQDGHILASRLIDNTLYLLSTCYVYNFHEDEPETFVPALYTNDARTLIAPDCIAIMPYVSYAGYTIVSAINVPSGKITANQTILGGGSIVYMSEQNLYIADCEYKTVENSFNYGIFTATDYLSYTITNITRLAISKNSVEVAAYGSVPGSLNNQFYMDEYKGHLRVVTTDNSFKYSVYKNEALGLYDYKWDGGNSSNGLYVLDMSLARVGAVDNLAPGEIVYSVRFDGDIGYFVTFRTVDPLFAVDLSNPQKPEVLSALKIPGFSQYLHVFSDGLLFGLGYDADENTGMRGSMKLSMFDTSNPKDVTEAHTLLINSYYSTALYNHKAILVDSKKNIIGFPSESAYLIYGYNNQTGFYLRASISLNNASEGWWWAWNNDSRGLYISNFFYIVSDNGIAVIDMETFKLIAAIS